MKTFSVVIRHGNDAFAHRIVREQPQQSNLMGVATGLNEFFAEQGLKFIARVEEDED